MHKVTMKSCVRYQVSGIRLQGRGWGTAAGNDGDKKSIFRTVFAICRVFLLDYNE